MSKKELYLQTTKEICRQGSKPFAIVDELTPVRFLSREEFEMMKKLNKLTSARLEPVCGNLGLVEAR